MSNGLHNELMAVKTPSKTSTAGFFITVTLISYAFPSRVTLICTVTQELLPMYSTSDMLLHKSKLLKNRNENHKFAL